MDREHRLIRKRRIEDRESDRFAVPREGLQPVAGDGQAGDDPRRAALELPELSERQPPRETARPLLMGRTAFDS
jgi:hypothetical protein